MKRLVYMGDMLLGDGLMMSPALETLIAKYPDTELVFPPNHPYSVIYSSFKQTIGHMISDEPGWRESASYLYFFPSAQEAQRLALKKRIHMTQAFFELMGLSAPDVWHYSEQSYLSSIATLYPKRPVVVCAPYSVSCDSRKGRLPNKMIPQEVWVRFWSEMSDWNFVVVSGHNELPFEDLPGNVSWARPNIDTTASFLRASDCVVTVDNGLSHLAAAVDANIVSVYCAVPEFVCGARSTRGLYRPIEEPINRVTPDMLMVYSSQIVETHAERARV